MTVTREYLEWPNAGWWKSKESIARRVRCRTGLRAMRAGELVWMITLNTE